MISDKVKNKRISSILLKLDQIYDGLKLKDFNSLKSLKNEFGGNYLLYSYLKQKEVIIFKDNKFVWNKKVKPNIKLAEDYFDYQYMKYKLCPSRILRNSKFSETDKKPKVIEISVPKQKKNEFSILWGLFKFKF